MDPVSTTASVVTLLGATGGTIKVIYNAIHAIVDAPREIRMQSKSLESFCSTITSLIHVYEQLPNEFPLNLNLCGIEEFIDDARSLQAKLKAKDTRVKSSNIGRVRESCKWLLFDRQLKKFFDSLEHWNIALSQALWVAQITLSNRILEHTSSLVDMPHYMAPGPVITGQVPIPPLRNPNLEIVDATGDQGSMLQASRARKRLSTFLAKASEPTGTLLKHRYQRDLSFIGFAVRGGRVIVKRWSDLGNEAYTTLPQSEGYSCSLVFLFQFITRWSLIIIFFGYQTPSCSSSLNIRWTFRLRRVLSYNSPCFIAIERGDLGFLQHQLSSGDLKLSDCALGGYSLLHFAARYNRPSIVSMLMNAGLDVNVPNDRGETPLHIAVQQGNTYECARRLLDNGADAFQQDMEGRSPLHHFYNDVVQQILLQHGEEIDPWMQDRRGMTILHWVAWSRRSSHRILPCSYQKAKGPSYLDIKDAQGKSMLHYAVQRGNLDLVTFFLASPHAATMSMPDFSGRTLLHYATESGQMDTINFLLDNNFNLGAIDDKGRTVLHHAAMRDNLAAAQRLIGLGATDQLACEDYDERTPQELAQCYASNSVIEYFQSLGRFQDCRKKRRTSYSKALGVSNQLHRPFVRLIPVLLVVTAILVYLDTLLTRRYFF